MSLQILQLPLGPVQTNCYVVADSDTKDAVVIDPGWSAAQILTALDERAWQLRAILLTHAHFDHIGGVADLLETRPVPLALHPLDLPLLHAKGGAAAFGLHVRPCPEPDVSLQVGQMLDYGSLRFEVLFVPGHTPGHVAFYHTEGVVFSGDVLFKDGIRHRMDGVCRIRGFFGGVLRRTLEFDYSYGCMPQTKKEAAQRVMAYRFVQFGDLLATNSG